MTKLNLAGYQETTLCYAGTRTLVYRATRDSDRQPVIIKTLRSSHPKFPELLQFRNQYVITRNLEHPAIVSPLSLELYENGYALVMPDDGAIALSDYWQQSNRSVGEFLAIATQLAEALHYLTQQRIIHKDIKPPNIVIHAKSGQVKTIDFSISSLLPKEKQQLINPNVLEGTLAYISPEQTGRMNRGIDYRTDFYSLGVTFFELLTGQLPFDTLDPMELVHCHITQAVQFPKNSEVPEMLQAIVLKLMAKNAEDRYQSALGLKHDLQQCWQDLEATGEITPFELGQRDRCDRFLIPEKLYGRQSEVQTLLDAFDRVANGATEMMLVAGFSGIGKTAVIEEVHKPIVKQRGYFIKGKFDQFNRTIPFSAFVQAFRDLMRQLLGSSDAELATWKEKILSALGENGQVIIEVIPELERIIGPQPPVPELSGSAAQNRFNLLFGKFVRLFATKEHPLVIFLDDLQWSDSASLNLLKLLMEGSEANYLLILGAYRDNEVFPAHPLMLILDEIRNQGATLNTLTLAALGQEQITGLVADALLCSTAIAAPLSELVYQKTQGNPFFTTQFLLMLYQEGCIAFEADELYWKCDLAQVRQLALTDNVVEFMVGRLQKLPEETQEVLKLAACIGNRFELATLAIICEASREEVATNLWRSLQEGFVVPQSETYKFFQGEPCQSESFEDVVVSYRFLHDRVQQAAYALIPDEWKQQTHYHIGQLLLQQIPVEARVDRIFEIVGQLNDGASLITEQQKQDELAELNLIACRKARAATAYQAGREYAQKGLTLLDDNSWERQYELTLGLHEIAADLASLCGDFTTMESLIQVIFNQATTLLDKVNAYGVKIQASIFQERLVEAIDIAQQVLGQFGINFPSPPTQIAIDQEIAEIEQLIGDRDIEDIIDLPIMTNRESLAIIKIANSIIGIAYRAGSPLFPFIVSLPVKLSLQYGNTTDSVFTYASYSLACNFRQDIDMGAKFCQLGLQLASKLQIVLTKPEIFNILGGFLIHRKSHLKETLSILRNGYLAALEVGNLEFAGYNAQTFCLNALSCGQPLGILERDARAYSNGLLPLNQFTAANWCRIYWQTILNLTEGVEDPTVLSGEALQEPDFLAKACEEQDLNGLYFFYFHKLMLSYLFDEIDRAKQFSLEAQKSLIATAQTIGGPLFYFYDSLTDLSTLNPGSDEATEAFKRVEKNQTQLKAYWAHYAPMNHQHKVDLVEAEKCRVLGQKAEAIELYDKAIAGAKENEYIQEEALANELAAKFYLNWGKEKIAATYMMDAYYCYARWGAKAKTDQLEQTYPQLLTPILQPSKPLPPSNPSRTSSSSIAATITTTTSILDINSAIKGCQALSEEMELEALLSKLMYIVLENAGADTGVLLLNNWASWEVVAELVNGKYHFFTTPLDQSNSLPLSIIHTVRRTQQTVLLNSVEGDMTFAGDPYLIQKPPKSLVCKPILNQGKLIGILYLENHLAIEAFTSERIEALNLLSTQAAISIENARLYQRLEDYSHNLEELVEQRTEELQENNQHLQQTLLQLQQTQAQLVHMEKMSSLGQMMAGIAHEINNPINFIAGNLIHAREYFQDLLDLLTLYEEDCPEPSDALQDKREEIDIEFLGEDLENLLNSMQTGSDRIKKIILGLRNFFRLQESEKKEVDIHEGLENTFLVLQHRLNSQGDRPEIAIIKNYGQLPPVNCYASQLNQVFLHILTNAIDVLTSPEANPCPEIRITTEMGPEQTVRIRIADNGCGMSESIRQKVFDPFFTTKAIGQGTGLGLSISYQIITEQHKGQLHCVSKLGEGTEFLIEIPV
ncbi:trifunctional serine/threonine-protein kinase/ATP-binding protein/sensor histidine kinase [Laspinema sp. A4]|uniref:trifunctional serine/threonine-protein kinase/ATP-binding protein/sensor histidine kinase n=1 Tax=Laspinema sp. D2d TaxID=2953686 RepID=UPI0021BB2AA9|nr:ATP-binding sensor histidine kinase [Laspinema sp. D2d]MCT7984274.1 trifunctional serine/threonine-protein kinase/ATP-binding protein/sensor histidine kinase [Laspinema sp. D2d]